MLAQDVCFGVHEPGGLLGAQYAHVADSLQPREVVVLECHPGAMQLGDAAGDVRQLEADGGVVGPDATRLRQQRERGARAVIDELATGLLSDRPQTELAFVELPGRAMSFAGSVVVTDAWVNIRVFCRIIGGAGLFPDAAPSSHEANAGHARQH